MKKLSISLLMLLYSVLVFAQFPTPYCGPLTFPAGVEPITMVNFAGINNITAATSTVAHENFIVQTANVTAGQTYPISLKGNTVGEYITSFTVFVDWNQDADFNDVNETFYIGDIFNSTGTDTNTLRGNITIPSYVRSGSTRLRVVKTYTDGEPNFYPGSCSNLSTFGQAEDYSIVVTSIPQCLTGTKFPANVVNNLMCDGSTRIVSTNLNTNNYFEMEVVQGKDYKIISSRVNDFFTISTKNANLTLYASANPVIWHAELTDTIRVYLHSNISCGVDTFKRTTNVACGLECLNGNLFPTQTFVPAICDDSTANVISTEALTGQYSNVQVQKGYTYVFSTGVNSDIITLSLDGEYVSYKGNSPLLWRSDTTHIIRFYANIDANCNVDTLKRTKSIICKSLALPGCVSNMYPKNNDTLYVSIATYEFGFDAPTTGGEVESYVFNVGLDSLNAFYVFEFPPITQFQVTLDNSDINKTYYWWIVTKNAVGSAICNPIKYKFKVLQRPPVGININKQGGFTAYPNPVEKNLAIINSSEIEKIEIINSLGQLVGAMEVHAPQVIIDMSNYPSGIYQLKLTSIDRELKIMKVIKK